MNLFRLDRQKITPYLCILLLVCCTLTSDISSAQNFLQRVEIPSSPNPVGSGARALGMGGAFIAVADDATAASWNPGGLMQLELPEISVVFDSVHRIEDNAFAIYPKADGDQTIDKTGINYLSAAYPFNLWNHNMIVSLNYQSLYDFTRQWNFPLKTDAMNLSIQQDVDLQQEGKLTALGLAYAIQITPKISAGLTLNIWNDDLSKNEWYQKISQWGSGNDSGDRFNFEADTYDRYTFKGFNANLGMLWNVNGRLTLGAVLKTPFEADLEHEHAFDTAIQYPEIPGYDRAYHSEFTSDETLDMPLSFGIGVAYRFSHALTVSFDIYRTEWDDFVLTDSQGRQTSPITGLPPGDSGVDPTHQIRTGIEYIIIEPQYVVPLRAGIFYDPAPARGNPDDIYGISIGSGIGWNRLIFDMAYQLRFGNNIGGALMKDWGFSQDLREHTLYASLIIHF